MSAALAVEIRLLDGRLSGWGFPRWGSAPAAGLDLHACLDAPLALAPFKHSGAAPRYAALPAITSSRPRWYLEAAAGSCGQGALARSQGLSARG